MAGIILVPLDGSAMAEQGLSSACRIACVSGAPLMLVRAVLYFAEGGDQRAGENKEVHEARIYLDAVQHRLEQQGFTVTTKLLPCDAVRAIVFAAETHNVGLISICSHGSSGLRSVLLGSVAEEVLRRSTASVLLTRARTTPIPQGTTPYRTILVALDGTPFAESALTYLLEEHIASSAVLQLLTALVPSDAQVREPWLERTPEPTMEVRATASATYLDALGKRLLSKRAWRTAVATGAPAEVILLTAEQSGAELIVIASHGRHGLQRLLHGSVAGDLVHRSAAPLLILRSTRHEALQEPAVARLVGAASM